jgi:hypothetical protein
MPGLDNANPIVIRPTQHSVRSGADRKVDLWTDGALDEAPVSLEEEPTDPIDGQEVFGAPRFIPYRFS